MKFIIGFLLLFAGLKAIGSVPYRFSESPWISNNCRFLAFDQRNWTAFVFGKQMLTEEALLQIVAIFV